MNNMGLLQGNIDVEGVKNGREGGYLKLFL